MAYKLKIFKLLVIILMVLTLASCKEKKHVTLDIPDQIIIYNKEKQIEVGKDSKHFKDIITLTNERIPEYVGTLCKVDNELTRKVLSNSIYVEFTYDSEKQHTRGTEIKKFHKLLFPLNVEENKFENLMLYVYNDNFLDGPGSVNPSKKLNKLIDNLIKENKD